MQPGLAVDAVFVLSVRTFHDRIAHIERELGRHDVPFEFIFEFDKDQIDQATMDAHFGTGAVAHARNSLCLKHLHAWRLATQRGLSRILVLEDDVILVPDFRARLAQAMAAADALLPAWLVFLGGAGAHVPDSFFLERGALIALPNATAEAYVTDLEACRRRVTWSASHKMRFPADRVLSSVDEDVGVAQYWTPEPLVAQGSVTGLFDSVLDSNRMKHSYLYNVARHRWLNWRRRTWRKHWVRARHRLASAIKGSA